MRKNHIHVIGLFMFLINFGCANKGYPENMTEKERDAYYQEFNESKTEAEWEEIRSQNKSQKTDGPDSESLSDDYNEIENSISFSVKNNSLLPKKLKIVDNILDFKPFEKRYFGFEANTKVYLINGQKEEFLFTISENDEGKEFKIAQ